MHDIWQDVKFGWRTLGKNKALSLVAVLSLALAIGANTAIYTVWNAVMNHQVAAQDPARLVNLYTRDNTGGNAYLGLSYPNYQDYAKDTRVFSGLAVYGGAGATLTYHGHSSQAGVQLVSGNYFQVLGVRAALGRVFTAAEAPATGKGALVVLGYNYWQRQFGGDPGIVGRTIELNGQGFMVAGVAPAAFNGTTTFGNPEIWAPITMYPVLITGQFLTYFPERRPRMLAAFGRLAPGVTLQQAKAAVKVTARELEDRYPADNRGQSATLIPLLETGLGANGRAQFEQAFLVMMAVVGLVLLIACANVANLLLARGMSRHREISVRLAMGASRGRLVRQLLVESSLLALIACGVGLAFAQGARDWLWAKRPPQLVNTGLHLHLDGRVLLFALAVSLAAGIGFGLAPALQATGLDLTEALKERSEPAAGGGRIWSLRNLLLVGEIGFALVALIVAGLFLASLRNIQSANPGFDAAHLASMNFDLGTVGMDLSKPGTEQQIEAFDRTLLQRARALPGVTAATLANGTPMAPSGFARSYQVEGRPAQPGRAPVFTVVESVTPGSYFRTMGIAVVEGRDFAATDTANSPKVIVINQTMAKQVWPGQDPVGKRVLFTGDTEYSQVVGVARDSKYFSLSENPTPFCYFPLAQYPQTALGLTVRTAGPPEAVLPELRNLLQQQNPLLAATRVQTAETPIARSLWPAEMGAMLLGTLALLALLLAAIGIYGVMAYGVRQRRRELGVRMAMGAGAGDIFKLVLGGGMSLVGIGLALGLAGAWVLSRAVGGLLYGLPPTDLTTYVEYSLLLVAVALLASFFPARRATRVDPAITLRSE